MAYGDSELLLPQVMLDDLFLRFDDIAVVILGMINKAHQRKSITELEKRRHIVQAEIDQSRIILLNSRPSLFSKNFLAFTEHQILYVPQNERQQFVMEDRMIQNLFQSSRNTYIITQKGKIWVCGDNECGQLGLGHTSVVSRFQQPLGLHNETIKKIVATHASTYLLTKSGKVWVCGNNENGQLGFDPTQPVTKFTFFPKSSFIFTRLKNIIHCLKHLTSATTIDNGIYQNPTHFPKNLASQLAKNTAVDSAIQPAHTTPAPQSATTFYENTENSEKMLLIQKNTCWVKALH